MLVAEANEVNMKRNKKMIMADDIGIALDVSWNYLEFGTRSIKGINGGITAIPYAPPPPPWKKPQTSWHHLHLFIPSVSFSAGRTLESLSIKNLQRQWQFSSNPMPK